MRLEQSGWLTTSGPSCSKLNQFKSLISTINNYQIVYFKTKSRLPFEFQFTYELSVGKYVIIFLKK